MDIVDVPVQIWKQKKKKRENTNTKMTNNQREIFHLLFTVRKSLNNEISQCIEQILMSELI